MELSEANLRSIIAGRAVGTAWPFAGGSAEDIDSHLHKLVEAFKRSPRFETAAERDHYGSGYASYIHLFCYKRQGKSTKRIDGDVVTDGLAVYLCRLAPLAVYGYAQELRFSNGRTIPSLEPHQVGTSPPGDWRWEINEVRTKLNRFGFELPEQETLSAKLSFAAVIPTSIASGPHYRVFDAVFYHDD